MNVAMYEYIHCFSYFCMLNANLIDIKTRMEITMYDNLLLLPLFQGLSKNDMTTIIEKVKLHFHTFQEGEMFIQQGAPCNQLCFLLSGEMKVQTKVQRHAYSLSEVVKEPSIIEPHSVFGMQTNYTASYLAHTPVSVLTIDKSFIFRELCNYEIFQINYLNILSNRNQLAYQKLWNAHIGTLSEKFVNFIALRSQVPEGEKTLQITMEDLANLINETRINLSRLLNDLQNKGLVQLKRKEIFIPRFEKLVAHLNESTPNDIEP